MAASSSSSLGAADGRKEEKILLTGTARAHGRSNKRAHAHLPPSSAQYDMADTAPSSAAAAPPPSMDVIKFAPLNGALDVSFLTELSRRKLNVLG